MEATKESVMQAIKKSLSNDGSGQETPLPTGIQLSAANYPGMENVKQGDSILIVATVDSVENGILNITPNEVKQEGGGNQEGESIPEEGM